MNDAKIDPALTADEWVAVRNGEMNVADHFIEIDASGIAGGEARLWPAVVAIGNDKLRDDDPRKITGEWIAELRLSAKQIEEDRGPLPRNRLAEMADALESYLPPQ